jgi:hypothetical protein
VPGCLESVRGTIPISPGYELDIMSPEYLSCSIGTKIYTNNEFYGRIHNKLFLEVI